MKVLKILMLVLVVFAVCSVGGLHVRRSRSVEVPILAFHKIGSVEDNAWWLPRASFERHIAFLSKEGYETVLPADLVAHRRWGRSLPKKPIILSFDGGFHSMLTAVEPVLERHGYRGICYLPTGAIAQELPRNEFEGAPCLTWSEVREMHARGTIAFGGYTVRRRNIANMLDPERVIEKCYDDIVTEGGFEPDAFAYPHGQYSAITAAAVRRSRFSSAVTTGDEVAYVDRNTDLYALKRVGVKGGERKFEVQRVPAEEGNNEVFYYVKNHGVPVDVTPRIVSEMLGASNTWLPSERLHRRVGSWRWSLAGALREDASLHLELWDKNRILLLYKESLSGM